MAASVDRDTQRPYVLPTTPALPHIPVPTAVDAEEAVLGSLLMDSQAITRVMTFLHADHFYREKNGWVYAAALSLYERREPIDYLTVRDELDHRRQLDALGGASFLTGLINTVPTSVHIETYGRNVYNAARRRGLIQAGSDVCALAYVESDDIDATLDKAEQVIFAATHRAHRGDLQPLSVGLKEVMDRIDNVIENGASAMGLPTGLADFDRLTGGLHDDEYIVVAAPPSVGKSAFLGQIAKNVAGLGKSVAIFSVEMSISQWAQRFLAEVSNIDQQRIRLVNLNDSDVELLIHHSGPLGALPLFIDDTAGLSPTELRSKARRFAALHPLDLVIVDYAQLMRDPDTRGKGNRTNELERISLAFKELARELHVPVLVASQISRESVKGSDKRPQMDSGLGSGAFERDADVWMALYREGYWITPNMAPDAPPPPETALAEIIIRKNRNGRRGMVPVGWQERLTRFVNVYEATIAGQREAGTRE